MDQLTQAGAALVSDLSQRYGLSEASVRAMTDAVVRGGGSQAQFSIPELGGMGQWSRGGMTMVGDMFNTGLQATVANLCGEISNAYWQEPLFKQPPSAGNWQAQGNGASLTWSGGTWWPAELGQPASSGSQNTLSYAIFPQSRRLAVNLEGRVTVYDTLEHNISGISQQQSGDASWTFTSQYGTVRLAELPVVSPQADHQAQPEVPTTEAEPDAPVAAPIPEPAATASLPPASEGPSMESDAIFSALEKLGQLKEMGVLTDEEFTAKKTELLARL
ncbi:SHOCT domain-containing protein [Donghicola sp. XS_ASV15]|uniref:SHOCT domain-containing protein n=1 Tax=Donghicola sp. XS_ASV15 TaxID=3241295 RepID=UPI003514B8B6